MTDIKFTDIPQQNTTRKESTKKLYSNSSGINFLSDSEKDAESYSLGLANRVFPARSEQELIDEFGADLQIPAGQFITIYYANSFTQTIGFRLNTGSGIAFRTQSEGGTLLTYSPTVTTQPFVEGFDPGVTVNGKVAFYDYFSVVDGLETSILLNLKNDNTRAFVFAENALASKFAWIGRVKNHSAVAVNFVGFIDAKQGIVCEDCTLVTVDVLNGAVDIGPPVAEPGRTIVSVIATANTVAVGIDKCAVILLAGEAFIFYDKDNQVSTTRYTTFGNIPLKIGGTFYKKGFIQSATVSNDIGVADFNIPGGITLRVNDKVKHTDFPDASGYNGDSLDVGVVNTDVYEVGKAFTTIETGNVQLLSREIVSVSDDGNGKAQLNLNTGSGSNDRPVRGEVISLTDFATQTVLNRSATVLSTGVDLIVVDIPFVASDSGRFNFDSANETTPIVTSENNGDEPDSMTIAELRNGNLITVAADASVDVPIVNAVPVVGDFIQDEATERLTIDPSTGIMTYDGLKPIVALLNYQYVSSRDTGGSDTIEYFLRQNGVKIAKTSQSLLTDSNGRDVRYNGIIDVNPGDQFQLFLNAPSAGHDVDDIIFTLVRQ